MIDICQRCGWRIISLGGWGWSDLMDNEMCSDGIAHQPQPKPVKAIQ